MYRSFIPNNQNDASLVDIIGNTERQYQGLNVTDSAEKYCVFIKDFMTAKTFSQSPFQLYYLLALFPLTEEDSTLPPLVDSLAVGTLWFLAIYSSFTLTE